MTARVAAGVPTGGQFAASARPESGVSLAPQEPPAERDPYAVEDVKVSPQGIVKTRSDGIVLGRIDTNVDADGKKSWTPVGSDGEALTYPATGGPRRYTSRTNAVQGLLNALTGDDSPERWADAPAYDWTQQQMGLWGKRFAVADMTRDTTLLHGSPRRFEPGDVLVPDQAPVNFKQSDPFTVALTNERGTAIHWAHQAARSSGGGTFYVYEVEPLTPVKAWRYVALPERTGSDGVQAVSLRLEEGRVGAARIVSVTEVTR